MEWCIIVVLMVQGQEVAERKWYFHSAHDPLDFVQRELILKATAILIIITKSKSIIQIALFLKLPIHWSLSENAQNCFRDFSGRQGPGSPPQGIWSESTHMLPPNVLTLIDFWLTHHSTECPLRARLTLLTLLAGLWILETLGSLWRTSNLIVI